ncbi:dipeptidase [Paenactinomyces guangxiensis]|uniref:Membrane dipeptidase n=1 Tax=Paenactinomyces guangxiensis TaxID=1490290 RepID=A0A7W1WT60_9BACL|nr:dipeptidase [Paenactinomyces guangxiensis]MBA4495585.1 membrane dipeptidase [Paenactinomyces guangxiensis]MBH8592843.1 dipeptidase [Paenactinomyces guangxiensis]
MREYSRIHRNAHVVDAHFDLLMDVEVQRGYGRKKIIETNYLPEFLRGGVNTIVSSVFVDSNFVPEMSLRKALNQISALYAEADESPEKIMICKKYDDIVTAKKEGKVGFILSLEGAEPLYNDLSLLRIFYELGVRIIGLVWSRRNYVGEGSHFSPVREGKRGGITDFGVQLIKEAEKMGIVIDVSHLNDEGFWDVMQFVDKPVIASHSNCRSIANTMRNLTDEQIQAIAAKDGVIGMNATSFFTADTDEKADVEHLLDHVDHIAGLVGVKHIGLGLDLCENFMKYVSPENLAMIPRKPFDVVKGHSALPQLTEGLGRRGYSDGEIELILGKNFIRVFAEVWG